MNHIQVIVFMKKKIKHKMTNAVLLFAKVEGVLLSLFKTINSSGNELFSILN